MWKIILPQITIRGMISDLTVPVPSTMSQESTVLLGKVRHDTQIQLLFQDDSSPSPNDVNDVNDTNDTNDANDVNDANDTDDVNDANDANDTTDTNDTNPPQSLDTLVGGLEEPKRQLQEVLHSALFPSPHLQSLHVTPPKGVLLFGPPGSGKTLLVRSLVCCYHTAFFAANIAALLSQYLGESEKRLARLFARARAAAPAIIFLDEIDALCPPRDQADANANRLCSLLLSLFDELIGHVIIIAATNRYRFFPFTK